MISECGFYCIENLQSLKILFFALFHNKRLSKLNFEIDYLRNANL